MTEPEIAPRSTRDDLLDIFTFEHPLGPLASSRRLTDSQLKAIYDDSVELHQATRREPPTFIVGRRGAGKTALLLSRSLDRSILSISLSTIDVLNTVNALLIALSNRGLILTEEAAAEVWYLLLWAPVINRLVADRTSRDSYEYYQRLWSASQPLREGRSSLDPTNPDDLALSRVAEEMLTFVEGSAGPLTITKLGSAFRLAPSSPSWAECVHHAQTLISERRVKAFVLIDSLENIGPKIEPLALTLRGLLHLVGTMSGDPRRTAFRLQCCFPSELWPDLLQISANPMKDLERKLVLQWHADDLLTVVARRLRIFLSLYPECDQYDNIDGRDLVEQVLPAQVVSRTGNREPTIAYMLRHTQLLPRQILSVFSLTLAKAFRRGRETLDVRVDDVVAAVTEAEATLCPEVFSAHSFRHPYAQELAQLVIPFLPFRFSDSDFHEACTQAGTPRRSAVNDYVQVRDMFVRVGLLGRVLHETDYYVEGEFEYTVEGQLNLGPDEEYCLHPLFVRQHNSRDIRPGAVSKPVYPLGTPLVGL
jgi:hypothetical protein